MTAPLPDCPESCKCPPPNGVIRRATAFGGLIVIFAAIALKVYVQSTADWLIIGLALVGGALIPNTRVVDLLQAWQKRSSNGAAS